MYVFYRKKTLVLSLVPVVVALQNDPSSQKLFSCISDTTVEMLLMLLVASKIGILLGDEQWEKTEPEEAAEFLLVADRPDSGCNKEVADNPDCKSLF